MDDFSYCIPAILIGLIPAAIAHSKGRDFLGWWIFGAALFIVALPAAILASPYAGVLERRQLQSGENKKCPKCAEIIKREAKVCRYCGANLLPSKEPHKYLPAAQPVPVPVKTSSKTLPPLTNPLSPAIKSKTNQTSSMESHFCDQVREYYSFLDHYIITPPSEHNNVQELEVISKDGSKWLLRCISDEHIVEKPNVILFYEFLLKKGFAKGAIITQGQFAPDVISGPDPKVLALVDGFTFKMAYQKMKEKKMRLSSIAKSNPQ